jgi:hypothetical protein
VKVPDSGGAPILVDQSVEALPTHDHARANGVQWLRRVEVERKMRSLAVVMLDVLAKNRLQMALAEDDQLVQSFVAQGLDHPFAVGVGSRTPVGREGDPGTFAGENLIELVDELGVPIMDGQPDGSLELVQLPAQVPCLLSDPGGVGMGGAICVQNAPTGDLHEDQHVESLKQHSVDGEEVVRNDRSGVGAEKLRPGRSIAARCGRNPMPAKYASDGGCGDLVAKLE